MSATLEYHDDNIYQLRVDGLLMKSELDAAQADFVQHIVAAGPIKLLVLLENFMGWEPGAAWDDVDFFFSYRNEFEKIAIVGDPRWEAEALAFSGAGMREGPVKFFSETDESQARAWLAA